MQPLCYAYLEPEMKEEEDSSECSSRHLVTTGVKLVIDLDSPWTVRGPVFAVFSHPVGNHHRHCDQVGQ
jgi:hypothetical protein